MSLNRKSSYVINLDTPTKCCKCGHSIKYASLTYHKETTEYIGLDCWEKEKEIRRSKYVSKYETIIAEQRSKDLKSEFIGDVSSKVSVEARLEKVIFLYSNNYGTTYLNIFRTREGNIISYKGKSIIEDVASVLFKDVISKIAKSLDMNSKFVYSILSEVHNFDVIETMEFVSFFRDYIKYNDGNIQDFTNVETNGYILLTGTIKELTTYKDIKQTLIERPKIR